MSHNLLPGATAANGHHLSSTTAAASGPVVVCVRGPSGSGKTAMAERLIVHFQGRGLRVGYLKRTHHALDLPHKASGRIWGRQPAAMLMASPDRFQLNLPRGELDVPSLLRSLPASIDLAFVETHTPEPYPTIVADAATPVPGESILGRWSLADIDADAADAASAVQALLPRDPLLHRALREAAAFHGGHACAGLILGTRLALHGAALLGIDVPDRRKRLITTVEIDRCAADAIQSVTGCRAGRRTLRFLDFGKLAATFVDQHANRALRIAVTGDLRDRANALARPGEDRHEAQRRVYLSLPPQEVFVVSEASPSIDQSDLPGPPRRRVRCLRCGEEVSDGRDVHTDNGPHCRPCALSTMKGARYS